MAHDKGIEPLGKAMEALCRSAATSYSGNLTPEVLVAFLRSGVVPDDCRVQLGYAIEELPPGLWGKALRGFEEAEKLAMKQTISAYAERQRLYLSTEMSEWLAAITCADDTRPPSLSGC